MKRFAVAVILLAACRGSSGGSDPDATGAGPDADTTAPDATNGSPDAASPDGSLDCGTPAQCMATWEQAASDAFDGVLADPTALHQFLHDVPKGGDLHNHLTGAVYAETYLGWGAADGDCINTSTHAIVYSNQCSASTQPVPSSGTFYDATIDAWSMRNFVAGAETGHDHFFATFGKYGAVAGAHRNEDLADIATRAADENEVYVETMFNMAKNTGTLAASVWSGTLTANDLPTFYANLTGNAGFATAVANDVNVVTGATSGYRADLGCNTASPPAACNVGVRYVAQISRTGANDNIFGQMVGAFEMAKATDQIVALNLSSPEDDSASISNYHLHMQMLDYLYGVYHTTSPLHITLHAGELTAAYLPQGSNANTFHIREAVELGHAERIGHGLDIESETNPDALMDEMAAQGVMVEVCLSSNDQILEVSGAAHPLAQYLAHDVPVALATDDQGVSRSSLAGEMYRAATDQQLDYRQLKTMSRTSLEHAFLPGASLWTTLGTPVDDCAGGFLGGTPDATCAAYLATSEKATKQWELETSFLAFEQAQ